MISLHNSLHLDKLRWLFWMRWKMFLRGFTRASGRVGYIIGTIVQLLFGLLIGGGIAVASYFAYHNLPTPANAGVLFLVLTGAYLLWLVLPLMTFSVNEGLDISKLALFPLTRGELMMSLLFSTLLDIPTIGLFLVLGAVVLGWAFSIPLALFALLTMLIFYAQIVGMSQLILALLSRVVQSRRFRDLATVLIILLSSSCYIVAQVVARGLASSNFINVLKATTFAQYLQWLPPGMAARAVQQASIGNWGMSMVWLSALLVVTVVVLYLWQLVVERGLTSTEGGSTVKVRRRREQPAAGIADSQATSTGIWGRIIPAQVRAIALKDLKYYRRDPQLLGLVSQSLFYIGIMLFFMVTSLVKVMGPRVVMIAPLFIFFSLYLLSYNMLGFERQGLTTLFLFPIDPKRVLWGKNLVLLVVGLIEVTLLVSLTAFLSHGWDFALPAFAAGLTEVGIILGLGNFTSVFFPIRMRQMGRGFQVFSSNTSTQTGCLRGIMALVMQIVMLIVLIPVALALVLPTIFSVQWVWAISIPAALVYGAVIYFGVTALAASRMIDRVPEILAVTTRE